ncbi:hypothetical protein SDC9_200622 [bioreactor metagenome]|uniref:Uncharacterized protein n=1 Tax=bioreactor metagenome TaxID=1076179 RepID=A0A645IRH8_9ZZZZ
MDSNLNFGFHAGTLQYLYSCRCSFNPIQHNAVLQMSDSHVIQPTMNHRSIRFVYLVPGMGTAIGEIPIVGQQQQAFGIVVQSAHRKQPWAGIPHQVQHCFAPSVIAAGRKYACGLIQHNVYLFFRKRQKGSIHGNRVGIRIDIHTDRIYWFAVDSYPSLRDEGVGSPP